MNLDQGDIALMVANARGLASLGMAGGYDDVLYELSDALDALHERAEAAEARCARLQQAIDALCSEPTHSGPAHDRAVRVTSYRAIREHFREALAAQWLRDLREREGSWGKPYERAMAASAPRGGEPYECEEERDQLAARCARLQQALAQAEHDYEECATSRDIARERDGRKAAALEAVRREVDLPEHIAEIVGEALAGLDTPADSQGSGTDPRGKERPRSSEWGEGANRSHMPSPADSQPEDGTAHEDSSR